MMPKTTNRTATAMKRMNGPSLTEERSLDARSSSFVQTLNAKHSTSIPNIVVMIYVVEWTKKSFGSSYSRKFWMRNVSYI